MAGLAAGAQRFKEGKEEENEDDGVRAKLPEEEGNRAI